MNAPLFIINLYILFDNSINYLIHPFNVYDYICSMPFDYKTTRPSKFLLHYLIDFPGTFTHFIIYAAASGFHLGSALYVSALILQLEKILQRTNTNVDMHGNSKRLPKLQKTINQLLIDSIELHTKILK